MNLKLRLKNKATLLALILCVTAFAYQLCGIIGVTPQIDQEDAVQFIGIALNLLVAMGVLVDPTTAGVGDSELANSYDKPRVDYMDPQELERELVEEQEETE